MKFISILFLVVLAFSACSEAHRHIYHRMTEQKSESDVEYLYFDQRNDHFSKNDLSTFKQRYLLNESQWRGNGHPIFVLLGGEGPIGESDLSGHFYIAEKSVEYGALTASVEHRFYGQTVAGDGTLSTENLRLLSADQALADYAVFIDFLKKKYNAADSKVVVVGGSYSGNLAAWMRQKYPNLVDIAYATSAPVKAQLDYPEYFKVIMNSVTEVGTVCRDRVVEAFQKVEELIKSNPTKLLQDFNGCSKMTNDLDEVSFLESVTDPVCSVVQYSGDNNNLGRMWNVSKMCSLIGTTGDAYESYAAYARYYLQTQNEKCMDSNYQDVINFLRNAAPGTAAGDARSWTYQTCYEYGYYQTVESNDIPFSKRINLDYYTGICRDVFGTNANTIGKSVDYTNAYYGARNVGSSKIVFLNGSVDPWHALGFTTETANPEEMPVFYIKGTAHCADMYGSRPTDLPTLVRAREQAWKYLDQWLNEN